MWMFDWFWNVLSALGLYKKSGKLVFLGLDNAGKSTLLGVLRDNEVRAFMPTQKPTMEELQLGGITLRTYDLGGHEIARRIWREYYAAVDGVVFLVDAAAPDRFKESLQELHELLQDEELGAVPFLVLGNKCDLRESVSEPELRQQFGLTQTYGKGVEPHALRIDVRPVEVFMCSVVKRQGYNEAFQWLAQFIK